MNKLIAVFPDVAGSHRDDDIVFLHDREEKFRHFRFVGNVMDFFVSKLFRCVRDKLSRDSLDRLFAGGIHIRQNKDIRIEERASEILIEVACT